MSHAVKTVAVTEHVTVPVLVCDGCNRHIVYHHPMYPSIRKYDAELQTEDPDKWFFLHGEDFCPTCAEPLIQAVASLKRLHRPV